MAKQAGMSLSALQSRLDRGRIAPVYLITGPEVFLADEARRAIARAIEAHSGDYARSSYHGDEVDLATVLDGVRTLDLFSATRLVIVSPADRFVQRHGAVLAAYAEAPAPNSHLVLVLAKVDGRKKLSKAVQKAGGLVACNPLYQRDIITWIVARTKAMGRKIHSPAAARLAEFLGTDLSALAGELEKLATYLRDRKTITLDDVETVSLRDRNRVIYELTDAIGRRKPAQVLTTLNGLLDHGEKVGGILYRVASHMRRLWAARELIGQGQKPTAAATQVGVRFFVEQFVAQTQAFSIAELQRSCSALTECEAALKRSAMDERILLETTFVNLVRSPRD